MAIVGNEMRIDEMPSFKNKKHENGRYQYTDQNDQTMVQTSKLGDSHINNTVTNSKEDLKNITRPNLWMKSDMSLGASGSALKQMVRRFDQSQTPESQCDIELQQVNLMDSESKSLEVVTERHGQASPYQSQLKMTDISPDSGLRNNRSFIQKLQNATSGN